MHTADNTSLGAGTARRHLRVITAADAATEAGRGIVASGKYTPPRGRRLGRLELWRLDVYEGSPRQWRDALYAERSRKTARR